MNTSWGSARRQGQGSSEARVPRRVDSGTNQKPVKLEARRACRAEKSTSKRTFNPTIKTGACDDVRATNMVRRFFPQKRLVQAYFKVARVCLGTTVSTAERAIEACCALCTRLHQDNHANPMGGEDSILG